MVSVSVSVSGAIFVVVGGRFGRVSARCRSFGGSVGHSAGVTGARGRGRGRSISGLLVCGARARLVKRTTSGSGQGMIIIIIDTGGGSASRSAESLLSAVRSTAQFVQIIRATNKNLRSMACNCRARCAQLARGKGTSETSSDVVVVGSGRAEAPLYPSRVVVYTTPEPERAHCDGQQAVGCSREGCRRLFIRQQLRSGAHANFGTSHFFHSFFLSPPLVRSLAGSASAAPFPFGPFRSVRLLAGSGS